MTSNSEPSPGFDDYRPNPGEPGAWDAASLENRKSSERDGRYAPILLVCIAFGLLVTILLALLGCSTPIQVERPAPIPPPSPLPKPTAAVMSCTVVHIVDGDTLRVTCGKSARSVRLIGIDAPETVHPSKPDQCYGAEASVQLRALAPPHAAVTLVLDTSQGITDRYRRTLAYVEVDDVDVGLQLIRGGFAREYTYRTSYDRRGGYLHEQRLAQARRYGLWASC